MAVRRRRSPREAGRHRPAMARYLWPSHPLLSRWKAPDSARISSVSRHQADAPSDEKSNCKSSRSRSRSACAATVARTSPITRHRWLRRPLHARSSDAWACSTLRWSGTVRQPGSAGCGSPSRTHALAVPVAGRADRHGPPVVLRDHGKEAVTRPVAGWHTVARGSKRHTPGGRPGSRRPGSARRSPAAGSSTPHAAPPAGVARAPMNR